MVEELHVAGIDGLGFVGIAANEVAVEAFVSGKIAFGEIPEVVRLTIREHRLDRTPSMDDLIEADRWARVTANSLVSGKGI